jgi:hypothetical protein
MAHPVTLVPPSFCLWMSMIVEIGDLGKLGGNLRHMVEKRLNNDFQFIRHDS